MTGEGLGSREVDEHRLQRTDESSGFSKSRYCRALTIFALFLYRIVTREGKRGLLLCLRIRRLNCFVVGVHTIAYAYPKVKIVTAAVDPEVNDKYHVIPGIGELHLLTKLLILPTVPIHFQTKRYRGYR